MVKQDIAVQHHQFASKFKLYKSLVTSVLLYGCETWSLLADSEKKKKKKGSRLSKPIGNFSVILRRAQDQRLGAEQD